MKNYNQQGGMNRYRQHPENSRNESRFSNRQGHDQNRNERYFDRGREDDRYNGRNDPGGWDDFASDRDLYIRNGNEQLRDSRRRGYAHGNESGVYGPRNGYPNRMNSRDTGRDTYPRRGGSSSHSGTYYDFEEDRRRAEAYSENWSGSSWNPGNNAQRGNYPGDQRRYQQVQEHTVDRNNRFSGVRSRKNR